MTRDVPASETRVNMPVARPCDMRFSRTEWIPATWILDYNAWIPDSISWIPDSKAVDPGFHRPKLPGFRIPDYLTWGEFLIYINDNMFTTPQPNSHSVSLLMTRTCCMLPLI